MGEGESRAEGAGGADQGGGAEAGPVHAHLHPDLDDGLLRDGLPPQPPHVGRRGRPPAVRAGELSARHHSPRPCGRGLPGVLSRVHLHPVRAVLPDAGPEIRRRETRQPHGADVPEEVRVATSGYCERFIFCISHPAGLPLRTLPDPPCPPPPPPPLLRRPARYPFRAGRSPKGPLRSLLSLTRTSTSQDLPTPTPYPKPTPTPHPAPTPMTGRKPPSAGSGALGLGAS